MGINAGASAITGVYLGDQLLTKGGGGSATENIQAAIDAPDAAELVHYIQGPDSILTTPAAMTAIANDKTSFDTLVNTPQFDVMMQYYPEARAIIEQSPYKNAYLPGPLTLKKGYKEKGYFGEAQSSEFGQFTDGSQVGKGLDATTLAAQLGITDGTAINNTVTWQKFYWQGDIWYIAMTIIRYGIFMDAVKNAGADTGAKNINLSKGKFLPYLLTGDVSRTSWGNDYPNIGPGENNMWDQLLRPLKSGGFWETNYSDIQLDFRNSGNGRYQFCQDDNTYRYGPNGSGAHLDSAYARDCGWRPALRFVP